MLKRYAKSRSKNSISISERGFLDATRTNSLDSHGSLGSGSQIHRSQPLLPLNSGDKLGPVPVHNVHNEIKDGNFDKSHPPNVKTGSKLIIRNKHILIHTLSNTRVDKPGFLTPNLPDTNPNLNQNRGLFAKQEIFSLPNTAMDPYFSYDYETYMRHVTKSTKLAAPEIPLNEVPAHCHFHHKPLHEEIMAPPHPMPRTNLIKHCSFGLELLDLSETVIVKQCLSVPTEIQTAFQSDGTYPFGTTYEVCTRTGSPLLFMTETTNCINRLLSCSWLGLSRSFSAKIVDVCGKQSLTVTNVGLDCCRCFAKCCCYPSSNNEEFRVTLADGEVLGSISQSRGCSPGFILRSPERHRIINATGPKCSSQNGVSSLLSMIFCCFSCFKDDGIFYFNLNDKDQKRGKGKRIAQVRRSTVLRAEVSGGRDPKTNPKCAGTGDTKSISNVDNEESYDEPSYQIMIDCAPGLSLKFKALILASSFVIDFLYWQ